MQVTLESHGRMFLPQKIPTGPEAKLAMTAGFKNLCFHETEIVAYIVIVVVMSRSWPKCEPKEEKK